MHLWGKRVRAKEASSFADERSISEWAKASVAELLKSDYRQTNGQFDPQGEACRAEIAFILKRLIEIFVQ
ncbi:hypothetical protein AB4Z29_11350 [Paenibacillus sp. 2TAB23]|uniref:hypothetical protein n=1 Tax=Paenibacillus sp. 2TAB23 TaxID=3233004 RepID=UPI003F95799F